LTAGVVPRRGLNYNKGADIHYRRSAVAGIYKRGLYSRLVTGVGQWYAFLHKTETDNELPNTLTASVVHWRYFHPENGRRRALAGGK